MGDFSPSGPAAAGSPFRAIGRLRAMRAFERRHLHWLQTTENRDLVCEIGHHQEMARPLTIKQAYLLGIASVATVQRRLRGLRHAGCIQQRRGKSDRRVMELTLSPRILQIFGRYAGWMESA
jgi:hypothetical protein